MRTLSIVFALAAMAACGGSGGSSGNNSSNPPVVAGLDRRPQNLSCVAPARGGAGGSVALERVFPNLPALNQPLAMLQAPGDTSRWFVLEKTGRVRVFQNDPTVSVFDADFIALNVDAQSEGGLLGMAFHPNFAANGEVFLSYTVTGTPLVSRLERYRSLDGGHTLDVASAEELLRLNQDFANHNGGDIAFGPDGYLYVGFGDGGSGGDPLSRAQDTTNLLGTMLRIDVDGAAPYAIPADNPFAGNALCGPDPNVSAASCPEIFAWGLRNPWRFSFDRASGTLWVGDVGQSEWEEVDQLERGGNYGWDCREGTRVFSGTSAASCSSATGLIPPLHEYPHTNGNISITGGYVYRGTALPALVGQYVFADYGSGRIWRLVADGAGGFSAEELLDTTLAIASFAEDSDGELYVVDIGGGTLHRLVAGTPNPAATSVADRLSQTGCVVAQSPNMPAAGLIPYDVAAPFWSDGASKERWLAIPDGSTITLSADEDFLFPVGTVLMKHFRLNGQLVETRLFMRHPDGGWAGYSYVWDAQQSDASLVVGGASALVQGVQWTFPSENECLSCHTAAAGFSLGLESGQLNHPFLYPSGRSANQLVTLDHIALFSAPLGTRARPMWPSPTDTAQSLAERARAYLSANCAHCHRPGGPTPSDLDLRYATTLAATNACDAVPQAGDLGVTDARIIAPGEPDRSVLMLRMARRDAYGMPPLASSVADTAGAALLSSWILSLSGC